MSDLPPELNRYNEFLDALPFPDNTVFLYRVCMMLHYAGKMKITDVVEGDEGETVYFETTDGFKFHTICPYLDREVHLEILKRLKPMLKEAELEIG